MDGVCEGFGCAYEYADFLGAGYAGVDEIALEHDVVLHRHRDYNNRKFRALALVDCDCVCQHNLVKFCYVVFYKEAVECNGQSPLVCIDGSDIADVAVEYCGVLKNIDGSEGLRL